MVAIICGYAVCVPSFTTRDVNRSLGEIPRRLSCEASNLYMVRKGVKSEDLQKERCIDFFTRVSNARVLDVL